MSEQDALLEAIRQAPEDEALRLVYADLLEEQGDNVQARFIRLQCQLEPLRHTYHDDEVDALREEEERLIREHSAAWLGPLAAVVADGSEGVSVTFRRGFVEEVKLPLEAFADRHCDTLLATFPALHELVLFDAWCKVLFLNSCEGLDQFRKITIADWLSTEDVKNLTQIRFLTGLERLELWLGSSAEEPSDLTPLATLPRVKQIKLVQLLGGYDAEEEAEELAHRANELAEGLNARRGEPIAVVDRPFTRCFPLWRNLGHGMFAGRIDGRQVMIDCDREPWFLFFDEAGNLEATERRSFADLLTCEPDWSWTNYNQQELLECVEARCGFTLDLIHVREFSDEEVAVHLWPSHYRDIIRTHAGDPFQVWETRWGQHKFLHDWIRSENFVIDRGNDYYAGPDGVIHSS